MFRLPGHGTEPGLRGLGAATAAKYALYLFGVGWGLSGFCPGPAVAALVTGLAPVFAFAAAMMAGMVLYAWLFERREGGGVRADPEGLGSPRGLT